MPGWVQIRAPTMSNSTKDAVWDPLKTSGSAAVPAPPGSEVQIHEQGKDGGTEQEVREGETLRYQWFYS